jgi:rfaE bifunctional protein kinase chain/domain/rfaE bifunctional protein nucleotidyltransferase chain/domain
MSPDKPTSDRTASSRKICNLDRLLAIRGEARAAGRTVVHCHGCFDIVHPGHIHHLQYAKSLGDQLIVTVSADSHVQKGVDRPLIPDDLRASSLAALECVDWVYVNPDPTAMELLESLQPDVYVKGKEYERNHDPRFQAERDAVIRHGGRVVFSSGDVVFSSTSLIAAMEDREGLSDEKVARFRRKFDLTSSSLHGLLHKFRGQRIVVIGDYILDRYHFCDATGIAGEGPMIALRQMQSRDYDGGAAVVALHLASLGAQPTLITSLASDAASNETSMRLRGAGIAVESSSHRRQIVTKSRYVADQTKLFKVDQGTIDPLDSQNERIIAEKILVASQGAAAVVFADFGYGLITESLLERIMPSLRQAVPILTADVSGRQSSLMKFKSVDLLCPTERELRETLHDFSSGLGAVVWRLLSETKARQAIITLGKQGLVTFSPPEQSSTEPLGRLASEYLPAFSNRVIDPLGCGDALLATTSLALACGGSLQAAAYLGSLAAAIEIQQLGNQPITAERLADAINCREALATRLAS